MKLYLKFLKKGFINTKNYNKFDGNRVISKNNSVYVFKYLLWMNIYYEYIINEKY